MIKGNTLNTQKQDFRGNGYYYIYWQKNPNLRAVVICVYPCNK